MIQEVSYQHTIQLSIRLSRGNLDRVTRVISHPHDDDELPRTGDRDHRAAFGRRSLWLRGGGDGYTMDVAQGIMDGHPAYWGVWIA